MYLGDRGSLCDGVFILAAPGTEIILDNSRWQTGSYTDDFIIIMYCPNGCFNNIVKIFLQQLLTFHVPVWKVTCRNKDRTNRNNFKIQIISS